MPRASAERLGRMIFMAIVTTIQKATRRRLYAAEVVYEPVRDIVRCQACIWGSGNEFGHIDIS